MYSYFFHYIYYKIVSWKNIGKFLLFLKPLPKFYFMHKFHVLLCTSFYYLDNNQNGSQASDKLGFYTFF